jgi:large subunit ribosomal protein L24
MQNIIKRTQRAVQRAEKRTQRKTEVNEKHAKKNYLAEVQRLRASKIGDIAAARKARIEDWNLGPLAPNRAVGRHASRYGALTDVQMQPILIPKHMRRKHHHIVEGDRVMVMKGVEKGKIGTVMHLHKEAEMVSLDGLNMAYVDGSKFQEDETDTKKPRHEFNMPFSYDDVRIVHKWFDPRTETVKDVIVEEIEIRPKLGPKGHEKDVNTGERLYDRFVPGEGSYIPWPDKKDVAKKDQEGDTLRITVEENTFIPTLLIPPMPETVIDELRSKYSKFRTRHDDDYVEKMKAQDEASSGDSELLARMRTPLQEHRVRQQEAKKAAPPKVLTDDMLARIGQVMAMHRVGDKAKPVVKVDRDADEDEDW